MIDYKKQQQINKNYLCYRRGRNSDWRCKGRCPVHNKLQPIQAPFYDMHKTFFHIKFINNTSHTSKIAWLPLFYTLLICSSIFMMSFKIRIFCTLFIRYINLLINNQYFNKHSKSKTHHPHYIFMNQLWILDVSIHLQYWIISCFYVFLNIF